MLRHVIEEGKPLLMPRHTRVPEARRWLAQYEMRDAVIVPLNGPSGIVGALVVADRLGDVRTFEDDDALMLETVANHASVALRNGELIGQLRHDALHDALTGLPNRAHLQRRLAAALAARVRGHVPGAAVLILDLDEFKQVNETFGHQQGDRLLMEVALRLEGVVGATGTVARLGGDEFAVLIPGAVDENRALHLARRLLRALEQPVALDGTTVEVAASVGVAIAPAHATDTASLLKRADMAMSDAKTSTRRVRLYEPRAGRRQVAQPDPRVGAAHRRAAGRPAGARPAPGPAGAGRVTGVEALVRWEHPVLGSIAPEEFIPIAERSGLIGRLTTQVLDTSLAAVADWRAAGHDLGIAVNLSARSLQDADLVADVARLLVGTTSRPTG